MAQLDYKGLTKSSRGANRFAQALYNQMQMKQLREQRRMQAEEEKRRKKGGLVNTLVGGGLGILGGVGAMLTGGATAPLAGAGLSMMGSGIGQLDNNPILGQGISAAGQAGMSMLGAHFADQDRNRKLRDLLQENSIGPMDNWSEQEAMRRAPWAPSGWGR